MFVIMEVFGRIYRVKGKQQKRKETKNHVMIKVSTSIQDNTIILSTTNHCKRHQGKYRKLYKERNRNKMHLLFNLNKQTCVKQIAMEIQVSEAQIPSYQQKEIAGQNRNSG